MPPVKNLTAARRRRAAAERAAYIDAKTDGGAELYDYWLNLLRDEGAERRDRNEAARWLGEHGSAGKPSSNIDVAVTDDREAEFDLSGLTLDEVKAMEQLLAKAAAAPRLSEVAESAAQAEPDLVDAEIVP